MAIELPKVIFPRNSPGAIRWFWVRYWLWFFVLLPWMLVRQVFVSLAHVIGALATWNRTIRLRDGLTLIHLNSIKSFLATAIYGERFVAIHYRDTLIDPGPVFAAKRMLRYVDGSGRIESILATHAHEEHLGNAAPLARKLNVPIHGTEVTLAAIVNPERLSYTRRTLMGQPAAAGDVETRVFDREVGTSGTRLRIILSPGHCEGHASLYDPSSGVLFVGDSFLHTIFTSPNRDVSSHDWIETLERYLHLNVRTMIGTHGFVYSDDPDIRGCIFVTRRKRPLQLLRDKLTFLRWARDVVARGEAAGLPYSVIEASLFPWQRFWASHNWFGDESVRLFSGGEFSRTHFVRSLSRKPDQVPDRFPAFVRLKHSIAELANQA